MFGVLIVVLSPDRITDLGFSTRKCQISALNPWPGAWRRGPGRRPPLACKDFPVSSLSGDLAGKPNNLSSFSGTADEYDIAELGCRIFFAAN